MAQGSGVTQQTEGFLAECEVRVVATPETVFGFFTEPEQMCSWMGTSAELDPRPGGGFRVEVIPGMAVASGTYVEVDPPTRVVFSWGWEGDGFPVPPGSSTVEVTLEADGDGTLVRLRHSGLPDEQQASEHTKGWTHYLARLEVASAGGDPGPDSNIAAS